MSISLNATIEVIIEIELLVIVVSLIVDVVVVL